MQRLKGFLASLAIAASLAFTCFTVQAGYTVAANAPQITVATPSGTRTFAITVDHQPGSVVGDMVSVFLVEYSGTEWRNAGPGVGFYQTLNGSAGLLSDMQAAGGSVKFTQGIVGRINSFLATISVCAVAGCATISNQGAEPSTGDEAFNVLSANLNAKHLQLVNGVLILQ